MHDMNCRRNVHLPAVSHDRKIVTIHLALALAQKGCYRSHKTYTNEPYCFPVGPGNGHARLANVLYYDKSQPRDRPGLVLKYVPPHGKQSLIKALLFYILGRSFEEMTKMYTHEGPWTHLLPKG